MRLPSPAARARWSSARPDGRIIRDHRGRACTQRSRDRPLIARRDVERRERKERTVLCERPRSRREAFLLGERLLESPNALVDERCALSHSRALALCGTRRLGGACRLELETREIVLRVRVIGSGRRLGLETLEQRGCRLRPELEPLAASL